MFRHIGANQKGDTIVEVLLAVAVVSSVLGIAYSTMNRSLLVMRDNEERTFATRLAQGQLEDVKRAWENEEQRADIAALASGSRPGFCVNGGAITNLSSGVPANDSTGFNMDDYSPECVRNGLYHYAARFIDDDRLMVAVYWNGLASGRVNQVIYYYRLR